MSQYRCKVSITKKQVSPDATLSSPTKEAFSALISEIKFMPKENKFDRLSSSIKSLLESVCDDAEEMKECALFLMNSLDNNQDILTDLLS